MLADFVNRNFWFCVGLAALNAYACGIIIGAVLTL